MNKKKVISNQDDLQKQNALLLLEIERLKAEKKCDQLLLSKYRSIYHHAYDSFLVNTIDADGPGRFQEVNNRAIELFGYSLTEFESMSFFQLLDEDSVLNIKSNWNALDKLQSTTFESRSQTKQGQVIFIEISLVIIQIEDKAALLSSVRDITSKKMAQKELQVAKERAEESEKLKSAFLANISHEIRTPMNAIAGFSNLLIQDDIEPSVRIEYVNIINTNTNLLLRLITDIIDVSKIESGTLKIIHKRLNVNRLFSNLYDVFTSELRRLNKPHIKLLYSKALSNESALIVTDPVRLSQILNNLIFNSIKFTDKGFVEFGYEVKGDSILFYVKDSGIGIVADKQDVIFDHFRQENDEVLEKNHGGTGLGLSISKKLVELLGGKIWVESETNVGSSFYFTHPYYKIEQGGSSLENKELKFNWSGKTILLVENSEQTINLFSIVLFETNVSLLVARTAEEALHLCSSNPSINVVIMDMELPDMNGYRAIESILNARPYMSVIIQTVSVEECNDEKLLELNIKHVLSKPVRRDILFNVLKTYLE